MALSWNSKFVYRFSWLWKNFCRIWDQIAGLRQGSSYNGFRLTGHCQLRNLLHLMRKVDSPTCRICGEVDETLLHLPSSCLLRTNSFSILGSVFEKKRTPQLTQGYWTSLMKQVFSRACSIQCDFRPCINYQAVISEM